MFVKNIYFKHKFFKKTQRKIKKLIIHVTHAYFSLSLLYSLDLTIEISSLLRACSLKIMNLFHSYFPKKVILACDLKKNHRKKVKKHNELAFSNITYECNECNVL